MVRIDLDAGRCDMLVGADEIARRKAAGTPPVPGDATPWQRIQRQEATQLSDGAVLRSAAGFHAIPAKPPRHNH